MTEETSKTPARHMLTVMVDLSHPMFEDRNRASQGNLVHVLSGCVEAAVVGSDATLICDNTGRPVGVYFIGPDPTGHGKAAFDEAAQIIARAQQVQGVRGSDQARADQPAEAVG